MLLLLLLLLLQNAQAAAAAEVDLTHTAIDFTRDDGAADPRTRCTDW